jgi:oligopeptide/dipeptide ABC transporter ATP-binding protein
MRFDMSRPKPAGRADRLVISNLSVDIGNPLVRDVSFEIAPGSSFGLVGESGSGKTLTNRAILGLLPRGARVSGSIKLGEQELVGRSAKQLRAVRGARIAMVFQDPMSALNPLMRVGTAIAQVVHAHQDVNRRTAKFRAVELMERVGIQDAAARARSYPHEFSGGMRQRIVIAMAFASKPSVLLADEPTTALDVLVQAEILALIDGLRREEGMSVMLVSHDFAVVAGSCDVVGVMYAGELVEQGATAKVLNQPRHPYTAGLLSSHPQGHHRGTLRAIPGSPPEPGSLPTGCAFAARCTRAEADCLVSQIPMVSLPGFNDARCLHPLDSVPAPAAAASIAAERSQG